METRMIFRERLTDLLDAAEAEDGVLTKDEIREILKDMPLEEEHYQLIEQYLAEQNVLVVESKKEDTKEQEESGIPKERRSLTMYMDEVSAFADVDEETETHLFDLARTGDEQAKARLIELYLPVICAMANEYGEDAIPAEDLIQEGNIGLIDAFRTMDEYENTAACRAHVFNTIRETMDAAVSRGEEDHRKDDGLVNRVNHLNDAIHSLERDLGQKVSVEEVSAYLEMPVEEIEDLLRVAGDQIRMDD